MRFAKAVFLLAGISGVALVTPVYFLEQWAGQLDPPPINQPVYFYGLVGTVLVFQLLYLLIASDPVRYRPVMLIGVLGKGSFAVAVAALYVCGRVSLLWVGLASMDATLMVLFLISYALLSGARANSAAHWNTGPDAVGLSVGSSFEKP